jgi:SAM-dependent methyltransferase
MVGWMPTPVIRPLRRIRDARVRAQVSEILARATAPDTSHAETDFARLQAEFSGVPEYGYDPHSIWKRAAERALIVSELPPDKNKCSRVLEVGCGDAMTGYLLSVHGHDVVVSDMDDWRDPRAHSLNFCKRILEDGLPYPSASFDLIFTYNAFEHFADPAKCFAELTRLTKPGGTAYLSFGPLYASPWGMHAWSSLKMPFCQYLFSEQFILQQLRKTGVNDLGKQLDALQPLNKWRYHQFVQMWSNSQWKVLELATWAPDEFLPLIKRYPECFSGRGLNYDDVTIQAINVTLRRQPAG